MPRDGPGCRPESRAPARRPRAFARARRLAGKRAFERVFAGGDRSRSAALTVLALANGLAHARLGLAVGRKHLPRAVDRNRAKRRIRESFRRHQHALGGVDVVVVARPGIATRDARRLRRDLEDHWMKIQGMKIQERNVQASRLETVTKDC